MGDIEEAASIATRAHECSGGDRTLAARALNLQGLAALGVRDEHSARAYFDQALKLWGDTDPAGRAIAHHNLALLAARAGDLDGARSLYQECLKERQASGDVRGEAETLGNLGALEFRAGDHEEARRVNLQSLDLRKSLRDRLGIALTLYNLGELAEVSGDQTTAIGLYAHADLIFCDLGSAYAAASREALDALRVKVGDDVFEQTRSSAVAKSWESILG
jgi:tetratricopeptide (TPR) repeat protein